MNYYEVKEERKKAIIAVCTLGLSEVPFAHLWENRNISRGFSWEKYEGMKSIINATYLLIAIFGHMVVLWIKGIVKLIYYSIQLKKIKNEQI